LEAETNPVIDLTRFTFASPLFAEAAEGGGGSPLGIVPGLLVVAVLFYFLMIRPERRKQATHRALLDGLKKNDRVVTIGGIHGVVVNVQREANEVTIKVDEGTNTKLRVDFTAIARVVVEQPTAEGAESAQQVKTV
jgi:preprotein translocase subunit YajC